MWFNYQLLAVITEVAQWGAPSCSQPQPATDNVRDGRSNWLVVPPTLHRAVPPELHVLHTAMRAANHKTCCTESAVNVRLQNARPTHCWCGHSGYNNGAQIWVFLRYGYFFQTCDDWAWLLNDRLSTTAAWSIKCLHWIISLTPIKLPPGHSAKCVKYVKIFGD